MKPELIGFLGLGAMGCTIATRLAGADYKVLAFDIDDAACREFLERAPTCEIASSLDDIARRCAVIFTCLPSQSASRNVFDMLVHTGNKGRWWIDLSTNDPSFAIEMSQIAIEAGAAYVEAPVVGGVGEAAGGNLFMLVASAHPLSGQERSEYVERLLQVIADTRFHVGSPGRASIMKALQNGLGLIQCAAIAEILAACTAAGIDPKQFAEFVINAPGMANTPLFRRVAPSMLDAGSAIASPARLSIAAKDIAISANIAAKSGMRADLLNVAAKRFGEAKSAGLADADLTRVIELFQLPDNPRPPIKANRDE